MGSTFSYVCKTLKSPIFWIRVAAVIMILLNILWITIIVKSVGIDGENILGSMIGMMLSFVVLADPHVVLR